MLPVRCDIRAVGSAFQVIVRVGSCAAVHGIVRDRAQHGVRGERLAVHVVGQLVVGRQFRHGNDRRAGQPGDGRHQRSAHFAREFTVFDVSYLQEVVVAHAAVLTVRPAQHGGVAQDQ